MRCCAPFCKNSAGDASTESAGISFHAFPSEVGLRAAWLRALGKQDSLLPDSAVVCSQHFLDDDICETESGLRQLATGAVPSTVQVCMICLHTDSGLFLMSKHKMKEAYEKLTGYPTCDVGNLKQALCIQCAQRLRTFSQFRDKSLRARAILMDLVEKHELITRQHIKLINRTKNRLDNNFLVTTLGPDPCDLYIQEHPSEEQQTDSDATLLTVEVKKEDIYDSMSVDEDINVEYVKNKLVASNEEYLNETKDPLKYESALLQCSRCYEQFESERAYERHMGMHGQAGAGDGERAASPACEARTAVSSSCPDTSLRARHGRPVQKARRDPQPTDLKQPAVALSSMRLGANNENKVRAEEADAVQKSEVLFEIYTSENSLLSEGNRFTCDLCKKSFKQRILLVKHIKIHSDVKPFSCKLCQYKTRCKRDLTAHIRTHTGEKPYCCMLCEYKASHKSHLSRHMRSHRGEKPFPCELCKYRCASKRDLLRHMRSHTGEKPFHCELCDYKSAWKCDLVVHTRAHTGEKPFICKLCDYRCSKKSQLPRHMTTHTGEKPFPCELCDYRCAKKSNLVHHMRTHTGEKPFPCEICDYRSTLKSDLIRHVRTHTGEKPFFCEQCDYRSAHKKSLVRHNMKTHTGVDSY